MARVLILHSGEGPIRGAEVVVLTMLELFRGRHAIRLVTDHEGLVAEARAHGHAVEHWTFPGARSPKLTWARLRTTVVAGLRLWRLIRRERIELVHVNNGHYAQLMVLPALLAGVPWLVHLHATLSRRTQFLFGIYCADRIVAVSNMVHRAWQGFPRVLRKCRTVYNTLPVFADPAPVPRSAFGIAADRFVIVFAGLLTPAKAVDVAIAAVAHLVRRGRPVHLLVVGDGPERDRLAAMAEGLPVTFAGYRRDVPGIFAGSADVVVLPSRTTESFGLVLLEAAHAGVPRIGSTGGGIPEVIADGEDGLLFPIDDAAALADRIERLMDDPALGGPAGRRTPRRGLHRRLLACRVPRGAGDELARTPRRTARRALARLGDIVLTPLAFVAGKLLRGR
ncbi:MAG: glycosyltransferase family 4 protein [Acetobacteraceae bacterium]|nr:glycosyltransferase family 4 protein [Acetobacteraceae bacterium]